MAKFGFYDAEGKLQQADVDHTVYRAAYDDQKSVVQYINSQFETDPAKFGTAFEQFMASCGLVVSRDNVYGIKPPSMKAVFEGGAEVLAGSVVRDANPASRIMFPAAIIAAVEDKLRTDNTGYVAQFDSMVSRKESVPGYRFEQPVLNYSQPEKARSKSIGQGALPQSMLSITVSDVNRRIPTFSLGMEITKEAQQATSMDLVTLALTRQAEIERAAIVDAAIQGMLTGDSDAGYGALPTTNASTLDSASNATTLTHRAYMKYLRRNWKKRQIDWIMCDLDTAMRIENRAGKPVVTGDNPTSERIDALPSVSNPMWQNVKIFLLDDGLIPANTIMGMDSRYAMWRVDSITADYTAVEEFVLRKVTALRFDFGYQYFRQFDEAFDVLVIA